MSDSIVSALIWLSIWSPGILLGCFLFAATFPRDLRKGILLQGLVAAIAGGCIGAFLVEPIPQGGWNLQLLFYPYLWCKWAAIGFAVSCCIPAHGETAAHRAGRLRPIFGMVAVILLGLTIANHTYVPSVKESDRQFWRNVFRKDLANLPLDEYRKHLSSTGRDQVTHALHYDKQIPADLLTVLLHLLGDSEISEIADQLTITPELVDELMQPGRQSKRFAQTSCLERLARNPATPRNVLVTLAYDKSSSVRGSFALNVAAPADLLLNLVDDEAPTWTGSTVGELARAGLGRKADAPPSLLAEYARDCSLTVRESVASNINAPYEELIRLTQDPEPKVSRAAWISLGASPNTPEVELSELAKNGDRNVRAAVARNPNTAVPLLHSLLISGDYETMTAAVRNLSTRDESSHTVLTNFLKCASDFTWREIANQKKLPKWVYLELTGLNDYQTRKTALERFSNLDDVTGNDLRQVLAHTDHETLRSLASSWRSSELMLRILMEDKDPQIRDRAAHTFEYVTNNGVYDK